MNQAYFYSKNTIPIVCKVKKLKAVYGSSSQKMPRAWHILLFINASSMLQIACTGTVVPGSV